MMEDSPMNNFCTLNSINGEASAGGRKSYQTLSEGNLKSVGSSASDTGVAPGTWSFGDSGKWYYEFVATAFNGNYPHVGMVDALDSENQGGYVTNGVMMRNDGQKIINSSNSSYGSSTSVGDVIGMAVDCDNGAAYFSINNTWQDSGDPTSGGSQTGAAYTWTAGTIEFTPTISAWNTSSGAVANFGQDSSFAGNKTAQGNQDGNNKGDFYYEPPSGFLALCTDNLSDPSIELPGENFTTHLFTGNNTASNAQSIGFQPDLVWLKERDGTAFNALFDSVRGRASGLSSNDTMAASTSPAGDDLASFDSNGFTVGEVDSWNSTNKNNASIVAWNWKAGGAPTADNSAGAGATPTAGSVKIDGSNLGSALAGSIAATRLSANTTSGFSIVKYVGDGNNGATIAHGLSVTPELVLVKNLSATANWLVGAYYVYGISGGEEGYQILNLDNAVNYSNGGFYDTPTASVIEMGSWDNVNENLDDFVMYCFHSVEGYSKVGSYTGNADADGPFIYTGFRPAYFLQKRVDATASWLIYDDKRDPYNEADTFLRANTINADDSGVPIDIVSNGFKIRSSNTSINGSGGTMLYLAFAESPFKTSNAR